MVDKEDTTRPHDTPKNSQNHLDTEERTDINQAEEKHVTPALFVEDTADMEKYNQTKIIQALVDGDEEAVEKEEECRHQLLRYISRPEYQTKQR